MNLNLSLQFDEKKKALLCGELVKFHLKITSPDLSDDNVVTDFIKRIGATVEGIEIIKESGSLMSSSSSSASLIDSLKGKKMRSVESLSNLLKNSHIKDDHPSQSQSKESQTSQSSMSSVTAKRFNSLRRVQGPPIWVDDAILVPLEAFIDPESIGSDCHKVTAKIKVSLNELIPIEIDLFNCGSSSALPTSIQSSHKLSKIGTAETSMTVLRPLDVSLQTHNLTQSHSILQLIIDYRVYEMHLSDYSDLEVYNVEIFILNNPNNFFKVSPISNHQIPFKFEGSKIQEQSHSILFNLKSSQNSKEFQSLNQEFLNIRLELSGRLKEDYFSLSFESTNTLPSFAKQEDELQISKIKILGDAYKISLFEPFQIELILNNFTKELEHFVIKIEAGDAHHSNCKRKHSHPNPNSHADNSNHTHNTVMEWFKMENDKKTPNILLSSPIDSPLKLENFPSGGSKSVILSLVPVKLGYSI